MPKPGQDHDVDLGVPEEPEQVLPQQRRAALGGVEEVGAEVPVGEQHRDRRGDHRQREDQQDRVGEDRPHEQRQPAPAHAAGAHVGDRRVEVDRAERARRGRSGGSGRSTRPGRRSASRWRSDSGAIARPAGFRRVPEDRGVEDDAAGQQQPEGERVQAREGHVARADHQRQEVVGQARPSSARRTGRPSSSRAS